MGERDERSVPARIDVSGMPVAHFDLVDRLSLLAERCVVLLDAAEVSLLFADRDAGLRVMASSTRAAQVLELLEMQSREGPCLDCYRSGEPVLNRSLVAGAEAWPRFAPMARAVGFRTVHALPMCRGDEIIGVVNVLDAEVRALAASQVTVAQALADIASIAIAQERALLHATELAEQLQRALDSRVVIEQAKGVIAERLGLDMDHAFALLRSYARNHNRNLDGVARDIVSGVLKIHALRGTAGLQEPRG